MTAGWYFAILREEVPTCLWRRFQNLSSPSAERAECTWIYTNDQQGEVERLVGIGATRYPRKYSPDEDFIVLEDPDGNRFCVVQIGGGQS